MGRKRLSPEQWELSRIRTAQRKLKWQRDNRAGKQKKTLYYLELETAPSAPKSLQHARENHKVSTGNTE
jgi:hypothetical protein